MRGFRRGSSGSCGCSIEADGEWQCMTKSRTRIRPTLSRRALLAGLAVSAGCTRLGCPADPASGSAQCHELVDGLTFFSHVPGDFDRTAPLFVAVHGTG